MRESDARLSKNSGFIRRHYRRWLKGAKGGKLEFKIILGYTDLTVEPLCH